MKMNLRADQHHCRDVALLRLYIQIHTSIQQRLYQYQPLRLKAEILGDIKVLQTRLFAIFNEIAKT